VLDDTTNDAERYAAAIADELEELERLVRDGGTWEDDEDGFDPFDSWEERAVLDIDATVSLSTGTVASVTITRTVGGPGCWIECHGDGNVRVLAVWGSDESYRTVHAPTVDAWAYDTAELMLADPPADRYR